MLNVIFNINTIIKITEIRKYFLTILIYGTLGINSDFISKKTSSVMWNYKWWKNKQFQTFLCS